MIIKHIDMAAHPGGLTKLNIVVDGDRSAIAELVRKAKESESWELLISKFKKRRSLDANAYYWVLLEKLSKVLRISKDELHEKMLQDYGTFKTDKDGRPVVFVLGADKDPHAVNNYVKPIKSGRNEKGKLVVGYAVLKGSSELNTQEFSELLDGVVSECQEQGIETMTPLEIAKLKADMEAAWKS